MSWLNAALGFIATAYVNDCVVKTRAAGSLARGYCDRVGKPLLMIRGERVVDVLLGDPVRAEAVQRTAYPLRYPDKHFGAVFAVNTLESLRRPDLALREWRRVADKVFVVVPSWWSPHSWLKRWIVDPELKKATPVWDSRRSVYLLPVSDSRYGRRPWSPTNTTPSSRLESRPSRTSVSRPRTMPTSSTPSLPEPPSSPMNRFVPESAEQEPAEQDLREEGPESLPESFLSEEEASTLPDMEELTLSDLQSQGLGIPPSSSFGSPRALTVVSTRKSEGT
jgi:SAM-dependent methyltransferase